MPTHKCLHCALLEALRAWATEHNGGAVRISYASKAMGRVIASVLAIDGSDQFAKLPTIVESFLKGVGVDDVSTTVIGDTPEPPNTLN